MVLRSSLSCQTSLRALLTAILEDQGQGRGLVLVLVVSMGREGSRPLKLRAHMATKRTPVHTRTMPIMPLVLTVSRTPFLKGVKGKDRDRGSTPSREGPCTLLWGSKDQHHMLVCFKCCAEHLCMYNLYVDCSIGMCHVLATSQLQSYHRQ